MDYSHLGGKPEDAKVHQWEQEWTLTRTVDTDKNSGCCQLPPSPKAGSVGGGGVEEQE